MTLRRKILLGIVLALVPFAAVLRWNHRGRAVCDGVARGAHAFVGDFMFWGQPASAWREAVLAYGKRQDVLGARWIERGKWRIRLTRSQVAPDWQAVRAWHEGELVFDTCEWVSGGFVVDFPESAGARDAKGEFSSPAAFAATFQKPGKFQGLSTWMVSPVNAVQLRECKGFRWDSHADAGATLVEARHQLLNSEFIWHCWLVYRITPQAGIQLLAEWNRLPEPSEEWVRQRSARGNQETYSGLRMELTQMLISGQWRAAGSMARQLTPYRKGESWASLVDKTLEGIVGQYPEFKPMFDAYRAEMGTPWHEPEASSPLPAD